MNIEADVVKAISETMICKKCAYPCKAKENSSIANCVFHWTEILSRINPNVDWKEVRYRVSHMKEEE